MVKIMKSQDNIQALIKKAQGGDRAAFEQLFSQHRGRLEGVVRYRLGVPLRRRVEVEDVVQETFVRALRSVHGFRWEKEDSFFLWLSGIAVNILREVAGEEKRKPTHPLDAEVEDDSISQSHAQRREERFDRLQQALNSLSPEHKKVILYARLEKLPIREIAKKMHRSPAAVSQLLMRALQKLRDSFGDTESLHLPRRLLEEGSCDDE